MLYRLLSVLFLGLAAVSATAQERSITLASTTSTEQSGFFGYVLPLFEAETQIDVRVVAVNGRAFLREACYATSTDKGR
jgi:tungstate transport system substrate-binding protein